MKQSPIVLILAVLGVILGSVGVYYGMGQKAAIADLKKQVGDIDSKVILAEGTVGDVNNRVGTLENWTKKSISSIDADLIVMQQIITDITNRASKTAAKKGGEEAQADVAPSTEKPADGMYTIQKGDTVGDLAKRFGVKSNAIFEANPALDPTRMKVGAKIRIP